MCRLNSSKDVLAHNPRHPLVVCDKSTRVRNYKTKFRIRNFDLCPRPCDIVMSLKLNFSFFLNICVDDVESSCCFYPHMLLLLHFTGQVTEVTKNQMPSMNLILQCSRNCKAQLTATWQAACKSHNGGNLEGTLDQNVLTQKYMWHGLHLEVNEHRGMVFQLEGQGFPALVPVVVMPVKTHANNKHFLSHFNSLLPVKVSKKYHG